MISPEGITRLARMQGYADDIQVLFHEPNASNTWAHEIVAVRGALMVRKRFMSQPSLGELAQALGALLVANEWLQ